MVTNNFQKYNQKGFVQTDKETCEIHTANPAAIIVKTVLLP